MYKNAVEDSVGLIKSELTERSKSSFMWRKNDDGSVTIEIFKILIITNDLRLLSGLWDTPKNPRTGKYYFFEDIRFKDEEEVQRFFKDVKAQLPEDVKISVHLSSISSCKIPLNATFQLSV